MSRALLAPLLAVALAACGDNLSDDTTDPDAEPQCLDLATTDPPEGPLATAADFDTGLCDAASLDGIDVAGSFYAGTLLRLEPDCEAGYQVRGLGFGADAVPTHLHRDETGLLIRRSVPGLTIGLLICGAGDDGTLEGQLGYCFPSRENQGEVECIDPFPVAVEPFGWHEGDSEASGLELVAEYRGDPESPWPADFVGNVEVDGEVAYITNNGEALHIVDVSDPAAPSELGAFPAGENWFNDIKLMEADGRRYAVLAGASGVPVVDVTDPTDPQLAAFIEEPAHRIDLEAPHLYIADGPAVPVYDLTDPTAPVRIGQVQVNTESGVHAVVADGDRLYANAGFEGFSVLDPLPDPGDAVQHGRYVEDNQQYSHHAGIFEVDGTTYALHGDEVGQEPWFKVIDVTPDSPQFLEVVGEYRTRAIVASHNITMDGTRAFVGYYQDGVRILDLSDPSTPRLEAYFNSWRAETAAHSHFEGATDVAIDEDSGLVLVADQPRGLLILREP